MARFTSPLDGLRVAAPCRADWDGMAGDERVRFCALCSLNVYNLSGMTRREAEALMTRTEGRLCVRFYRRSDGTVLTRQCPVGLRALKARVSRTAAAVFSAVLGFFGGLGVQNLAGGGGATTAGGTQLMGTIAVSDPEMKKQPPAFEVTMGTPVAPSHREVVGRVRPSTNKPKR